MPPSSSNDAEIPSTPSSRHARPKRDDRKQKGVVLVVCVMALVTLLLATALVVDLGIGHVTLGQLSQAADAGALAGARHTKSGTAQVKSLATSVAKANFGGSAAYSVTVDQPSVDTTRVRVEGETTRPTFFARLMDRESIDIATLSEATRFPLDLSLVLDVSLSLEWADAFDDLQAAASGFLDAFDDLTDQVGIVAYSTWGWEVMSIRKNFRSTGKTAINALQPISDTNIEEGLRLGKGQIDGAPVRPKALKIMVLFTDGIATAFADNFRMDGPNSDCSADAWPAVSTTDSDADGIPDCFNGAMAGYQDGGGFRGIFRRDNGLKVIGFTGGLPRTTSNMSGTDSPVPRRLQGGNSVTGANILAEADVQALAWANAARAAGYTIYCIGLGDPNASHSWEVPDQDFLKRIANVKGMTNSAQPKGEMFFTPTPAELAKTFATLADRILTRLTQ
jgi:Flp pilus assembly protein TadG